MKRVFDVIVAALGLILLSPMLLLIAVAIRVSSRGPILFCQTRYGRGFQPFTIYKFRTMVPDAPRLGGAITVGDDPRITRVGRLLRLTKLDELPQLFNVLRGDMSLVGPRPEVEKYVEMFREEYTAILRVRPGVTDPASLAFRDESSLIGAAEDPEWAYIHQILPEKLRLSKRYVETQSLFGDVALMSQTVIELFRDRLRAA